MVGQGVERHGVTAPDEGRGERAGEPPRPAGRTGDESLVHLDSGTAPGGVEQSERHLGGTEEPHTGTRSSRRSGSTQVDVVEPGTTNGGTPMTCRNADPSSGQASSTLRMVCAPTSHSG